MLPVLLRQNLGPFTKTLVDMMHAHPQMQPVVRNPNAFTAITFCIHRHTTSWGKPNFTTRRLWPEIRLGTLEQHGNSWAVIRKPPAGRCIAKIIVCPLQITWPRLLWGPLPLVLSMQ